MIKNYQKQGGEHWVVGGLLEIGSGGLLEVAPNGVAEISATGVLRLLAGSRLSFSQRTPVNAKAASLTTNLAGANNDLVFTAVTKGADGDGITIAYVDPGQDAELSVVVEGTAIIVNLASSTGSITSTANDIKAQIESGEAATLVGVALADENTGEGVVTAMAATPLAGGQDGTVAKVGETAIDGDYLYIAIADNTINDANWRRIALGAAY